MTKEHLEQMMFCVKAVRKIFESGDARAIDVLYTDLKFRVTLVSPRPFTTQEQIDRLEANLEATAAKSAALADEIARFEASLAARETQLSKRNKPAPREKQSPPCLRLLVSKPPCLPSHKTKGGKS
jgi:hypothetical protein